MERRCEYCEWYEKENYVSYLAKEEWDKLKAEGWSIEAIQNKIDEECVYGFCHRYPPNDDSEKIDVPQPQRIWLDGWCGEFKAKQKL